MSTRRRTGGRSTRPLVLLPLLGALLVALAPTAWSQTSGPDQVSDDTPDDGPALRLVEASPWLDPDGSIVVTVEIPPGLPDDATVEVVVHEALRHRTDLRQTFDRSRLGGRLVAQQLGTLDELGVARGGRVTADIPIRSGPPVPGEPPRLGIANAGVHPIDVAVVGPDDERLAGLVTFVVRPPLDLDGTVPAKVVLVQPLGAPPSHGVDGSASVSRETRERWTVAASAWSGDPVLPVVLSLRPETLDALEQGGPLDRELVDTLAAIATAGAVAERTFVDVELDGAIRAGLEEVLADQLARGHDTLVDALDVAPSRGLWVAGPGLTTQALGWLVDRGIDTVVVPEEALEERTDDDPHQRPIGHPVRLATAGTSGVVALVTDRLLQAHQGATDDPVLDAQRLVADLALDWFVDPTEPRSHVVVLDQNGDPAFTETLRHLLATSPLLEVDTPVGAIASTPLATVETTDGSTRLLTLELAQDATRVDLGQLRRDLDLARLTIESVRSVFPDDLDLFSRYDTALAVLPSVELSGPDRSQMLAELSDALDRLLDGIQLPDRRAITLAARDGTIPLTFTNTSGRRARVAVLFESEKLDFVEGTRIEVDLPEGTTTVEVEVRARASGAFPLGITMESPQGGIELGSTQYTVRSTAVSGVGIAISVAAIVVLGVWWARTARRARAEHAAATAVRSEE